MDAEETTIHDNLQSEFVRNDQLESVNNLFLRSATPRGRVARHHHSRRCPRGRGGELRSHVTLRVIFRAGVGGTIKGRRWGSNVNGSYRVWTRFRAVVFGDRVGRQGGRGRSPRTRGHLPHPVTRRGSTIQRGETQSHRHLLPSSGGGTRSGRGEATCVLFRLCAPHFEWV